MAAAGSHHAHTVAVSPLLPRPAAPLHRRLLLLILLVHLALGLAANAVTPVFEGPDEPNHFLFIRYLQAHRRLPVQGLERDAVRAHHPPGYFWLGALLTAWDAPNASDTYASLGLTPNPRYWFRFGDPEPDNKSLFLHHTPAEHWPYHGLPRTVRVARLLSLAFSTLAVLLTYLAARSLRPAEPRLGLLAAGLIAFNPMVVFMAGVVQNDTAALAAGAAVVLLLGRALRAAHWRAWALVGLALGAGILLKAGLLALGVVVSVALAYTAWCAADTWRGRLRQLALGGAAVALPVLLLAGWWLLRNQQLYGDWTGNVTIPALWGTLTPAQQRGFLPLALWTLSTGLLGRFGNGGIIEFPPAVYAAAGALALAAVAGVGRLAWPSVARLGWRRLPPLAVAQWLVHGLTVVVITASVLAFALNFNGGATGKYLFPAFPSLALLLAAGSLAWFRAPGWRGRAAAAVLALSLAACVYAVAGLLRPAYGPPRRPLPFELDRATALEADLGGVARVLGYRLAVPTARAGGTYAVTVYWLPQATTASPYTVFVHLYVPGVGSVAQRDLYPGGGTYPTTIWLPGRPFVDTYYLHLPADAPAADNAQVLIGLYDEASGQRLPATGADAGPPGTDWIEFGDTPIRP
jgi:4-amino-4-deoxy-L-arabinose transferase-like glycosyltransferase